jgi:hypothetical protein
MTQILNSLQSYGQITHGVIAGMREAVIAAGEGETFDASFRVAGSDTRYIESVIRVVGGQLTASDADTIQLAIFIAENEGQVVYYDFEARRR